MSYEFVWKSPWAFSFLAVFLAVGCGESGPVRCDVTGSVTLDGQPVEEGEVLFIPADGIGSSDACPIVAGEFRGDVAPGSKRVEISATKDTGETAADGLPDYQNIIPVQYNRESKLTAEVGQGDGSSLTFALESGG
jgi:hypothetical protein